MGDEESTALEKEDLQELRFRNSELAVWWLFGAAIVPGRFWISVFFYSSGAIYPETIAHFYLDILAGVLICSFPVLFRLTFGLLPLEYLRLARLTAPRASNAARKTAPTEKPLPSRAAVFSGPVLNHDSNPNEILVELARSSRQLSDRIFTRAGIYLIVGVLIAFSGLGFFYLQTAEHAVIKDPADLATLARQIATLAPRFGILFFIEFIAFFFLRQYRAAMEEFRYFDAVQRKREETLALVGFMKDKDGKVDVAKLLDIDGYFSGAGRLAAGESTELLESKKLTKDEMDVFMRIVDAVSQAKK